MICLSVSTEYQRMTDRWTDSCDGIVHAMHSIAPAFLGHPVTIIFCNLVYSSALYTIFSFKSMSSLPLHYKFIGNVSVLIDSLIIVIVIASTVGISVS